MLQGLERNFGAFCIHLSIFEVVMISLNDIKTTLIQLKPELQEKFHVKTLGIFGSAARNELTPQSDVDIIVDFDQPVGIAFIDLANYLESKMSIPVDLVSCKGIKPQYFASIEKEIIYV
jgi:predicted nucleotidyltransferase